MAGFVQWMAPQYDAIQERRKVRVAELRDQARQGSHRRTPTLVADLAFGWEVFLEFAVEAGAIDAEEAEALWERGWMALGKAAAAQEEHQVAADPVERFFRSFLRRSVAARLIWQRWTVGNRIGLKPGDGGSPQ